MIIDVHHHLFDTPGYLDRLEAACGKLGIDRVCLFGAGRMSRWYKIADDGAVLAAAGRKPGLVIPFACVDLGIDPPGKIDECVRRGFRGFKFINPLRNYDDRSFYPIYERIEASGLPALFHLGIVSRTEKDKECDIDNSRHRPIYLDTISRAFPNLNLIGAHLGNPWADEAAMAARWDPRLYFDLTGSTLKYRSPEFLGSLLWWRGDSAYKDPWGRDAWEKILFGTDVLPEDMGDVLGDYRRVMNALGLSADLQAKVLGGTAAKLLGLSGS